MTPSVCAVAASTVTIVAAGSCTIRASQPGNASFAAAANVDRTFAIAKANQSISFVAPAPLVYGAAPVALTVAASSKLPVALNSATPLICTLSGASLRVVGAGSCIVHATQAGNTNFNAAPAVDSAIHIAKAAQTISFAAVPAKVFGAVPFNVAATSTSKLTVSFASATPAVCAVTGVNVQLLAAGLCTLRASQPGDSDFNAAPAISQSFSVAKSAQTIAFAAIAAHSYGDAPFALVASASSGLPITHVSATPQTCKVSAASVSIVATGGCTIRASQAGNANFIAAADVSRSFNIAKAPQSILFAPLADRAYGVAPFTVTSSTTSQLPVTVVSTTLAVCTMAASQVSLLSSGICTLRASQTGNANFSAATDVTQSFKVGKGAQSISFAAIAGHAFGDGGFVASASSSSGLPVVVTSATPATCALSGSHVDLVASGTCVLHATQPGNDLYIAAAPVDRTFDISKAAQSISFAALPPHALSDPPFTLHASASSGLPVQFSTATPGICINAGDSIALLQAGTCRIDANQVGSANYIAAPIVSQAFAVNSAIQSIAFDPIGEQSLAASPVTAHAIASSGLNVTFASLTPAVCTIALTAVTLVSTGTCTARATQPGNGIYPPASPVDRSFAVRPIAQTILFPSIQDHVLSSVIAVAGASASSGLPVRYQSLSTSVCTTDGSASITLVAAGACQIRASQPGDRRYAAALDVLRMFNVQMVSSTVVFDPIGPQTLANSPLLLSAHSPAQRPIVYSATPSSTCAVEDSQLVLLSPGICSISASESADGVHPSGTPVAQQVPLLRTPAFMAPEILPAGRWPATVVTGRFHDPNVVDLAVPWRGGISLLIGDGHGAFTQGNALPSGAFPVFAAVSDFNNDGKLDFAVSDIVDGVIRIEIGDGHGQFELLSASPSVMTPLGVAAADVDGDGDADLIASNADSGSQLGESLSLLYGNGDGSMSAPTVIGGCDDPTQVIAADFNDDAIPDMGYVCQRGATVGLLINRAGGRMDFPPQIAGLDAPYRLASGDIDGDGIVDLAIVSRTGTTVILIGDGEGGFTKRQELAGTGVGDIAIADINADGMPDLTVVDSLNNRVLVFAGAGDGRFAPAVILAAGQYPQGIATADVDNNGSVDIVFANTLDGTVSILRNATNLPAVGHVLAETSATLAAPVGEAFAQRLSIRVSDTSDLPIAGALVRFAIEAQRATATFGNGSREIELTTNADGVATAPRVRAGRVAGTYHAYAHVADATVTITLTNQGSGTPPAFTNGPLPSGTIGSPYSFALTASGSPTLRFAVASGQLPPGVALSSGGGISGIPTAGGTFSGTFSASNTNPPDAMQPFSITVNVPGQNITFSAIPDQSINAAAASAVAAASSGLPVTFQSLSPEVCSIGGTTIQLLRAGRCTIRALQDGNQQFSAAQPVDRSFSIARGTQSVKLMMPEMAKLSSPPMQISASATSGLPVTLASQTPVVCVVVDPEHVQFNARGQCLINATQGGDDDFAPAEASATVSVAGAKQTIFFQQPRAGRIDEYTYLLATASSGLPVTLESLSTDVCKVVLGNVVGIGDDPGAPGNQCTIRASQPGDATYEPAVPVKVSFEFGFDPDVHVPLPSTPHVVFATYLGGLGQDVAFDVKAAPDGGVFVGSLVGTTNFPGISSQRFTNAAQDLIVISRLAPLGTLDYSVAVGGAATRITGTGGVAQLVPMQAMTTLATGEVLIAAYSSGAEWPVAQGNYSRQGPLGLFIVDGGAHVRPLVAALDPAIRTVRAISSDKAGYIYLTGVAHAGLNTTPAAAIDSSRVSVDAPYLMKLSPSGATAFATYLTIPGTRPAGKPDVGQGKNDASTTGFALVVDGGGNTIVVGQASAADFPATPGALDTTDGKNRDAFVAKVNPGGSALVFVARLGFGDADRATDVGIEPDGSLVVAGKTASADDFNGRYAFQTRVVFSQNGMQTQRVDREFGFLTQIDTAATRVNFMAAIGSFGGDLVDGAFEPSERPLKIAIDPAGFIYVAGTGARERTLPVVGMLPGMYDEGAFLMKVSPEGGQRYATFLGEGVVTGVTTDGYGNAVVTGYSAGAMPTVAAFQAHCTQDVHEACISPFVMKINDATMPVSLTTTLPHVAAGTAVTLTSALGDLRASGTITFFDREQVLTSVPLNAGFATYTFNPGIGVHHYRAIFHGTGYSNGLSSPDLIQYVTQRVAP